MKLDLGIKEESRHNYWLPVIGAIAGAVLVMFVFFIGGIQYSVLFADSGQAGASPGQVTEEHPGSGQAGSGQPSDAGEGQAALSLTEEQKAELEALTGIRSAIIADLETRLAPLGLKFEINKTTGNVRFDEAVLFNVNKTRISRAGEEYLEKFVPVYLSVLMDEKYKAWIERIIIEGHADDGGSYEYNLDLSQKRASAVADYIFKNNILGRGNNTEIRNMFAITGRSYSEPVIINGTVNREKSRRVEFAFSLKDEEISKRINQIIKGVGE